MAVTPASKGTVCTCAGMSFSSDGWLKMMLSGLATVPWLTEMVKLGRGVGPELPWVTAQMMRAATTMTTTAMAP